MSHIISVVFLHKLWVFKKDKKYAQCKVNVSILDKYCIGELEAGKKNEFALSYTYNSEFHEKLKAGVKEYFDNKPG